jgi:hypothetical protein
MGHYQNSIDHTTFQYQRRLSNPRTNTRWWQKHDFVPDHENINAVENNSTNLQTLSREPIEVRV